jgi:hypothetical protein
MNASPLIVLIQPAGGFELKSLPVFFVALRVFVPSWFIFKSETWHATPTKLQ